MTVSPFVRTLNDKPSLTLGPPVGAALVKSRATDSLRESRDQGTLFHFASDTRREGQPHRRYPARADAWTESALAGHAGPFRVEADFPAVATSAANARSFLREALATWRLDGVGEITELLADELV